MATTALHRVFALAVMAGGLMVGLGGIVDQVEGGEPQIQKKPSPSLLKCNALGCPEIRYKMKILSDPPPFKSHSRLPRRLVM